MLIREIKEALQEAGTYLGMPGLYFYVGQGEEMSPEEILARAEKSFMPHMIFAGSDPANYPAEISELTERFHDMFRRVCIETDAQEYLECDADLFSLRPKLRSENASGLDLWPADTIERYLKEGKEVQLLVAVGDELDFQEALIKISQHLPDP